MIQKKIDVSQLSFDLLPLSGKPVDLQFSGDHISSDGGLLLLREVESQIKLISSISSCITDNRDSRYIDHTVLEMVSQRVFQIAAGYEDCNDSNQLRSDMVIKACSGRLPQSGKDLASQPTMSRFENSVSARGLYRMGKTLVDHFIGSYPTPPEVIVIDCDDTDHITYGQQELTLFNQYYRDYCYMPLHIYEGLSGKLITTILKPGRRSKQSDVAAILKKLVRYLRQHWPKTMLIVRGDSHFASSDFMPWCSTQPSTGFITGLTGNAKLHELARVTIQSAEREYKQYGQPVKRYHSFRYKATSWECGQRVVVKVEVSSMGTNIRYIVTNIESIRAKPLYELGYCARGAMELRIKDHKLYLGSDRSSCRSFMANQFRLFLHSVAYVLLHTLQKEVLKNTSLVNVTFKTLREKIIKTAAWVRELKTRVKIEFPKYFPEKEAQANAFAMFMVLRN